MVFRMESTHYELIDKLDIISIGQKSVGYTLPPGIYEFNDIKLMLKSFLSRSRTID